MKVCKFERMNNEDEVKQVIGCIQKEHPYVAVIPVLTQLQEWLQAISVSWFHEEDETSHTIVNAIEEYCRTLTDRLISDRKLNQDMKVQIEKCIEKIQVLVEDKADLLTDKIIKAEVYGLSMNYLPAAYVSKGFVHKLWIPESSCKSTSKGNRIFHISRSLFNSTSAKNGMPIFSSLHFPSVKMYMAKQIS